MAKTIAVTGKGGTGKTVIAALIIKRLKECASGPVLALDADPDSNLGTVLGIPVEKTIGDLREETLKEIKNLPAGLSKSSYIEAGLHQIIAETDKVDLITMGRSEGPGCYCYMNSLLRRFAEQLETSYEWVVMDNEAGLEHLSRRTAARVHSLIVVVNNNPLSMDCAMRIEALIADVKNEVAHSYILANAVTADQAKQVRDRMSGSKMTFLGHVPHDPAVEDSIFRGRSLFELDTCPAVRKIGEMMKEIQGTGRNGKG